MMTRKRSRKTGTGACGLCGRRLRRQPGRTSMTAVAPAFAFRRVRLVGGDWRPTGPVLPAGRRVCTAHEVVWDVAAGRARVLWPAARRGGGR